MALAANSYVLDQDDDDRPSVPPSAVWATGKALMPPVVSSLEQAAGIMGLVSEDVDALCRAMARIADREDIGATLEDIRESTRRISGLLDEALRGVRERPAPSDTRTPLQLGPVVDCVVQRARHAAELRHVRIDVRCEDAVCMGVGRNVFERVLQNLLDNALRFSKEHDVIEVAAMRRGGRAVLVVADHGPGVPPQATEEIFSWYQRSGPGEPGSNYGLGLAFCREVARAHDGEAWVFNRKTGGACFVFEVP